MHLLWLAHMLNSVTGGAYMIVPAIAESILLDYITSFAVSDGWQLRLYKNNYTPVDSSTFLNFVECNFQDYAAIDLDSWSAATQDGAGNSYAEHAMETFVKGTGGTTNQAFGYYVTNSDPQVLWAERFDPGPIDFLVAGDSLDITARLRLRGENT